VKDLPTIVANFEDLKQLVRASGSVGANYIEANECIGKRDFVRRSKPVDVRQKRVFTGCAYWTVARIWRSGVLSSPAKLWS
jgi:hypothetical protein